MRRATVCLAAAAQLLAVALLDAEGLRGPHTGFYFDQRNGTIRQILGLPGGAVAGHPLPVPFEIEQAAVAARADYALVRAKEGGVFLLRGITSGAPSVTPVDGIEITPDLLTLAPHETTALLADTASRRVQVLRGLPDMLETAPAIELRGDCESPAGFAVNDGGNWAVVSAAPQAGSLTSICHVSLAGDGETRRIASVERAGPIALLPGDRIAIVADPAAHRVYAIEDPSNEAVIRVIAGEGDGITDPVGVGATGEAAERIVVVDAGARKAFLFDLGAPEHRDEVDLPVAPAGCWRTAEAGLFRVSDGAHPPLYLVSFQSEPKLYFVPVVE